MVKIKRCNIIDYDSIVVVKCQRCKGINLQIVQNYAPKSDIRRLRCKNCGHVWDVNEDAHMGYEEVK
jgi:phage FluMu protein Com